MGANDNIDQEFFMIKRDLVERISNLEISSATLIAEIRACAAAEKKTAETMQKNIEKLNTIIIGNGSIGLSENVRGLMDGEKIRKGHVKIFYGAIVVGFVNWVWGQIGHLIK